MLKLAKTISSSDTFQTLILFTLLITAVTIGLETVPELEDRFGDLFYLLFLTTQAIFCFEIIIRILSYAPTPIRFFKEFSNNFDFTVTALSLLPIDFGFITVIRLLRLLRVLRVISTSDRLRIFISKMERSLDELFFSSVLILILIYIFGICGLYLFSEVSPEHWGSLGRAMLSVFYLVLLQNVPQFLEPLLKFSSLSILYFITLYFTLFSLIACLIGIISGEYQQRGKDD
jgi:voltage-gated sodium channel